MPEKTRASLPKDISQLADKLKRYIFGSAGRNKKKRRKPERKKISLSTILLTGVMIVGLGLMLYPTVSDSYNRRHASRAIDTYDAAVGELSDAEYDRMWKEAQEYNRDLNKRNYPFILDEQMQERYYSLLDPSGSGMMGYIEIPSIDIRLPIYHGTADGVLQKAAGHLDYTSLPVGGESTHCVISGHRGLPSASLFTDLDRIGYGDRFTLCILNRRLTYEVNQIKTVLPDDKDDILVKDGRDYCTLVTCTPYGINSHRLLVRGRRVDDKY